MKKHDPDRYVIVTSFRNPENADNAISALRRMDGISDKNVGIMVRDDDDKTRFKTLKELHGDGDHHAGKGAAGGAALGAGGGALWALGIAAGALPAIGPVVGGGILGAIAASAGTGAAAGGIAGALAGLGMSDDDATFAQSEVERGNTVVVLKGLKGETRREALQTLRQHEPTLAPNAPVPAPVRTTTTDSHPQV